MVSTPNTPLNQFSLLKALIATLMDAVMVVNAEGQILQANAKAKQLCDRLSQEALSQAALSQATLSQAANPSLVEPDYLPTILQPLFAALLESRRLFPEQGVMPEFELCLNDRTPLRIRGQFLDIPRADSDVPYVLITIENRQESLNSVAIGDAQRFGFTPRETEIWYMRLLGRSYREIANCLYITENTVRKHVKNVLAKRRVDSDALVA
jgi:DNA-binding CsgD family transcriptional regulator